MIKISEYAEKLIARNERCNTTPYTNQEIAQRTSIIAKEMEERLSPSTPSEFLEIQRIATSKAFGKELIKEASNITSSLNSAEYSI